MTFRIMSINLPLGLNLLPLKEWKKRNVTYNKSAQRCMKMNSKGDFRHKKGEEHSYNEYGLRSNKSCTQT